MMSLGSVKVQQLETDLAKRWRLSDGVSPDLTYLVSLSFISASNPVAFCEPPSYGFLGVLRRLILLLSSI
jgi:hypothetical protein